MVDKAEHDGDEDIEYFCNNTDGMVNLHLRLHSTESNGAYLTF